MTRTGGVPSGFAIGFAALFFCTQLPLYTVDYVDITDFVNHLARVHVLENIDTDRALKRFYEPYAELSPNLALDAVVPLLHKWFDAETSLKLFASFCTLLLTTGTVALHRALTGKVSYLALGCMLFAHNAFFHLGLFNFLFGTGAALWLIFAWIGKRGSLDVLTLAGFTIGTTLIYLSHLSALGIYALAVLTTLSIPSGSKREFFRWLTDAGLVMLQFVPALFIHLFIYQAKTNRPLSLSELTPLPMLVYKATLVFLTPKVSTHPNTIVAAVIVAMIAFGLTVGFRLGRLALSDLGKRMTIAIAVAMLLLPPFGFGSNMVDIRLALPLVLVFWASLTPTGPTLRPRKWPVLAISAGVILASATSLNHWRESEPLQRQLREAMARFEEGSKVAVVTVGSASEGTLISPHTAAWSVIDRSTFLSSFFIRPFQPFLVGYRDEFIERASRARLDNDGAPVPPPESLRGHYDYVIAFGSVGATEAYGAGARTLYLSPACRIIRP